MATEIITGHHLNIHLDSASSLKGGSFLGGTTEFFCSFSLKDGKNPKNSSVKIGSDIHWNENFQLELPSPPEEETLFVNVWGKKKLFQNTLIGRLEIPLCLIIEYSDKTTINENHRVFKKFKLLPRIGDTNFSGTGYIHLSLFYSYSLPKNEVNQQSGGCQVNNTDDYSPSNSNTSEFSYQCSSCFQFILPTVRHKCEDALTEPNNSNINNYNYYENDLNHYPPLTSNHSSPNVVHQNIPQPVVPQTLPQFVPSVPQSPPQTINYVHKSPPQSPQNISVLNHPNFNPSNYNNNNNIINSSNNVLQNKQNVINHNINNHQNGFNQVNNYANHNNGQNLNNTNNNIYPVIAPSSVDRYGNHDGDIQRPLSYNNVNNNFNINANISNVVNAPNVSVVPNVSVNSPPQVRNAPKSPLFPDLISLTPMTEQERQLRMLQQIQQKHAISS